MAIAQNDPITYSDVVEALNEKAGSIHTHVTSDITDFPTIPTKTSDLTNDSGFLTGLPSHNHDDRYYTETEIDTKVEQLNNSLDNIISSGGDDTNGRWIKFKSGFAIWTYTLSLTADTAEKWESWGAYFKDITLNLNINLPINFNNYSITCAPCNSDAFLVETIAFDGIKISNIIICRPSDIIHSNMRFTAKIIVIGTWK